MFEFRLVVFIGGKTVNERLVDLQPRDRKGDRKGLQRAEAGVELGDRNHALLDQDISVFRRLAGQDDRKGVAGALIECETRNENRRCSFGGVTIDRGAVACQHMLIEHIALDWRHHHDGIVDIRIEHPKRHDRVPQIMDPEAIGTQNAGIDTLGRKMCVGKDKFSAMV